MARSKCIEFQNGKQEDSGYGILASFFHTFFGFQKHSFVWLWIHQSLSVDQQSIDLIVSDNVTLIKKERNVQKKERPLFYVFVS